MTAAADAAAHQEGGEMSPTSTRYETKNDHPAGGLSLALAAGAALILAIAASILVPVASARATSQCQSTPVAVVKANSKAGLQVSSLLKSTSYTPVIRTFTPKPSSTEGFTGYETIAVRSPAGTAPVVGTFKLTGNNPCSVVVTSAKIDLSRNSYLVKMMFPGEQGNPGNLKITLVSR
jgi:hypothetical protein